MRSGVEAQRWGSKQRLLASAAVALLAFLAGMNAACRGSITSPALGAPRYVGRWTGTLTSDVIGQGTLIVDVLTQTDTPGASLFSGVATRRFLEERYSGTIAVTGATLPGGEVGITFDRGAVPCPSDAGGQSLRTVIATLVVAGDTMRGTYVAGGCPGGTLELKKQ